MTREPRAQAQVDGAGQARLARPARDRRVDGDTVPAQRALFDEPGKFVAEHERYVQDRVTDPAVHHPVTVGTAQADGGHPDERLTGARFGDGLIVQTELAIWMQT
jgi:hypothetical protein